MSGAHSVLPPSGAKAWRLCAMWVTMNRLYPKPDTPESLEGNAAHWVAWEMAAGRHVAEGMPTPYGVIVTDEMLEGGELLVDTIRAKMPPEDFMPVVIEQRVNALDVHPECWGTPDARGFSPSKWLLRMGDYKFGHRFVDEYENDQCVTYVDGCIPEIAAIMGVSNAEVWEKLNVEIIIVQPRCFYKGAAVRVWSTTARALIPQINDLSKAAVRALEPNPQAVTNSECIDCPGRGKCAALQLAGYSDAEFAVTSAPVELSPSAASLELRMLERSLDRLQSRVEGMREVVLSYVRQGVNVPFHHAEQSYGRQQWTLPVDQVIAMGELMGVDLSKRGVVTPKQAQKSGVDEAVIKAYSITPSGSIKLVSDNPADVRRTFGNT